MNIKKEYKKHPARSSPIRSLPGENTEDVKQKMLQNVGARLAKRKLLFKKRKLFADCCVFFALGGILLMIIQIELVIFQNKSPIVQSVEGKDKLAENKVENGQIHGKILKLDITSEVIKAIITVTTFVLLVCLCFFHKTDVQVFMIDNGMDDWRLAMSLARVLIISLELFICLIHPFPGNHDLRITNLLKKTDDKSESVAQTKVNIVPIDVLLSLPMFLRFYLVCRCLMLHSRLYQDASAQSLGALNRIHFNFAFIFKSLMNLYSEYVLTILISFLFLWASWAMRACETYHSDRNVDFFDSMWVIAITFLTVGYGDIVPSSTCGKAIAAMTGIFGVGCTALVVAVLARKLELSRAEMYVHNFVISVELSKQMKHAAANVVKEGWLVHKYRRLGWQQRALKHERRLLQAIRRIREIKNDQSRMNDNSLSMIELYRGQTYMQKTIETTQSMVQKIHDKIIGDSDI